MIRIYYNKTTGEIISTTSSSHAFLLGDDPYIDYSEDIKIAEWTVDVNAKKLVPTGYVYTDPRINFNPIG